MAKAAAAEDLQAFRADLGTSPRVFYKNLHRWTKAFVAANVVCADTDENAEGATAVVELAGQKVGEAETNNYGDFVVDKLEPGREYTLTVSAAGYKAATVAVMLDKSRSLGSLFLEKA